MEKYKIAIVANSSWNIYNFRMNLIRHFADLGHRVFVLAPEDSYTAKLLLPPSVLVQKVRWLNPKSLNPFRDILYVHELYKAFKNWQPDIVLNYTIKPNIYGSLAAGRLGIKTISNLTGLGFTAGSPTLIRKVILQIYKWALKGNEEVIFHNEEDLNWFWDRNLITRKLGLVISGSGINADYFKPDERTKSSDPFVFIFVGRTLREKGILEFLTAGEMLAADFPKMQCWILGAREHGLLEITNDARLVNFKNKKPFYFFGFEHDVRERLSRAHVFVLPSYREGRSKAMLEAMAMELPVITTNVAGCRQTIIDGWHGYLVEPQNANDLSRAMRSIMNQSLEELSIMGKRCRQKILEQFESKHIFTAYDEVIENVMQKTN